MNEPQPSLFCQRWWDGQHSWRHRSEGGFDADRYSVASIDETPAKEFVLRHHYSGTYPAAVHRYGLHLGDTLVGVAVFAVPMQYLVLTNVFPDAEPVAGSLELARFVLVDDVPANGESWFLARCFEELAARGLQGVVSFSDPVPRSTASGLVFPGHVGTIYQATNAVYTGRGSPATKIVLPDGTTLANRAMSKVRKREVGADYVIDRLVGWGARPPTAAESPHAWLQEALSSIGATRIRHQGNHRYAFRLGLTPRQRKRVVVAPFPQPYPKFVDAA